jgi:hypothetical protein
MTEKDKQGRYPEREKIEEGYESLHKINSMMSQDRFKKYYAHLNDEKAHLVSENAFKKCEILIKEEVDYFKEIEIRFLNKLLWDIDKFIFDEEYSEQSIQATFENIERIVSEHQSETFSGVLNWEIFDKYLEVSDL